MRLKFKDQHDFTQEAFDIVVLIVSKYGQELLMSSIATPATEQCLEHLMRVASTWSYDISKISAMHSMFQEENDRFAEFGEKDLDHKF